MPYNPNGLVKDPGQAVELATLLQFLEHFDPATDIRDRLQGATNTPWLVEYHPGTEQAPPWAFASSGNSQLVLVSGCKTLTQAVNTAVGYFGPRLRPFPNASYEHPYFNQLALPIINRIIDAPRTPIGPTFLCGHSLGGCVVQAVAANLRHLVSSKANMHICTFGSPKFCWLWLAERLRLFSVARYMNSDDPVPMFAPSTDQFVPLLLSQSVGQIQTVNNFTQLPGGLVCAQDGDITAGHYPPLSNPEWRSALGAWLWTFETGEQHGPHSLSEYISRLNRWIDRRLPPAERPRGTERPAPVPADTSRVNNRAAQVVQDQLIAAEREQRAHPTRIPARLTVTVERRDRVHVVLWNGHVVSICTQRRTARSLARALNQSLRHMLTQGLSDPDGLQSGYDDFFQAARDVTSGVQPLLNETLPGSA